MFLKEVFWEHLFLVYIDDMLSLPKNSNCYCFADDTKLCSSTNILVTVKRISIKCIIDRYVKLFVKMFVYPNFKENYW